MRLPASLRASFYVATALVTASGIVWLLQPSVGLLSMEIHAAAAMALLVITGSTFALHAPGAWREHKNRASGTLVGVVLLILAVSGYLLYYLGQESLRHVTSVVHWGVGLAAPILLCLHVWLGRRSSSR